MLRVLIIAVVVLLTIGFTGCKPPAPIPEPPCDENNPYPCVGFCCFSYAPNCMGPDSEGYYCEPNWPDPDNPPLGASEHRIRPKPRER